MEVFVMALARGREVGVNVELIAFDADFAVDQRAAARVIREAESDLGFDGHERSFPFKVQSSRFKVRSKGFKSFKVFKTFKPPPVSSPTSWGRIEGGETAGTFETSWND
jgi:hypothetical protein